MTKPTNPTNPFANPFDRLPKDVFQLIGVHLGPYEVQNAEVVDKLFKKVMSDEATWHRIARNLKLIDTPFKEKQNYRALVIDYYKKVNGILSDYVRKNNPTIVFNLGKDPLENHQLLREGLKSLGPDAYIQLIAELSQSQGNEHLLNALLDDYIETGGNLSHAIRKGSSIVTVFLLKRGFRPRFVDLPHAFANLLPIELIQQLRSQCEIQKEMLPQLEIENEEMESIIRSLNQSTSYNQVALAQFERLQNEDAAIKNAAFIYLLLSRNFFYSLEVYENAGLYELIKKTLVLGKEWLLEKPKISELIKAGLDYPLRLCIEMDWIEFDTKELELVEENQLFKAIESGDFHPQLVSLIAFDKPEVIKVFLKKELPINPDTMYVAVRAFLERKNNRCLDVIKLLLENKVPFNVSENLKAYIQRSPVLIELFKGRLKEP